MADLQLYTLLYVTLDHKILVEETSITVNRDTGSQPVKTVAKGYSGESPGAGMTEIDVTNVVPQAGFEFDAGKKMAALEPVEMGVIGPGGKQLTVKGFIIGDSFKHSTGSESAYDFKFRGPLEQFK